MPSLLPRAVLNWQVVVELHVYVSRATLIKCEPTQSNYRNLNKIA